ncbi:hypothetical protein ANN_21355 [Periplaneta americana]|uniref:Uncharacterized protein n=1 Tax=Periplaneta americana TaxID=6978 RepID=A0ABQ8SF26_PERAM|nr:hypothetical protein ANN_21355 [Periplaneta americana]
MRGYPRPPGTQRSAHTVKADRGSGEQPEQASRLDGWNNNQDVTHGEHANFNPSMSTTHKHARTNTAQDKDGVLRMGWHLTNGSPVNRGGQLQIGLWFTTSQRAPTPHVPGHGFLHFWLLHASF